MLFRRFAAAIALVVAGLVSQLPEYTQQYRQRLGGAIDELVAMVTQFDREATAQSLTREQGIQRLEQSSDPLVQGRGSAIEGSAERIDRLSRQRDAFRTAGPVSQYAVLAESLDTGIAQRTLTDFEPALPVTAAGLIAAVLGFAIGWVLTHLAATPFRRRPRPRETAVALQPR